MERHQVATRTAQSEFHRYLSFAFLSALIVAAAIAASNAAHAQYTASGYQLAEGQPFFLLSDKAYGTNDVAHIRVEIAAGGMQAVSQYGGVDVALYRVPKPLEFLQKQRNLHRVQVDGVAAPEGVANTLRHLWDKWVYAPRETWRGVFSAQSRQSVVAAAPETKTSPDLYKPTEFRASPQFKPIPGLEPVDKFRYPVHTAQPIAAPKEVALAGSSSEFIAPSEGNVYVPLGKLKPGLYVVEAFVGAHRATTLVFVGDTIAITKTSADEILVWTAARITGEPLNSVDVVWSDGAGVLKSGQTDTQGIVRFQRATPERSYVFGADPKGGVFISENFYYDSEIYNTKIYAVTDRPLYRPGDLVSVKVFGREFVSARQSQPVVAGTMTLTVFDPNGAPAAKQTLQLSPETGGDTSFRLPENAAAGGYELRLKFQENEYSASFRVADYQKPHFEINLIADKADFKTNEEISGRLQLTYPDGKPVKNANVEITVRAQQLTMVEGDLRYGGQFPVKVSGEALSTDERGETKFSLPAADQPSRYIVTVFATDGAAYRVKTTKEILIERGRGALTLKADRQFSAPNEKVSFAIAPVGDTAAVPTQWEWVRLEDRKRESGKLGDVKMLDLKFSESGSYTVTLRDSKGNVLGAAPHWVSGGALKAPQGNIEIVPNKEAFNAGETADVLITFPEPVDSALLTLERDRVEKTALLDRSVNWIRPTKIAPTQWRAQLTIAPDYAPNITLSVAYVKNGEYAFQNQGLRVAQPRVEITMRSNKEVYAPGEGVDVEVITTIEGKSVEAVVAVGAVDEMIYVLQPEIAPNIYDFFYHPRRNNVRTAASLSFIGYDLAVTRSKGAPAQRAINQRAVKVLERPRRDDKDTAFWQPAVKTDASGRARISFTMPDALTRWRLTARAITNDGTVGQRVAYLRSERDFFVKWTSPQWMREGDQPIASIAAFNQTAQSQTVQMKVTGPQVDISREVKLAPGATYVPVPLGSLKGDGPVRVELLRDGKIVDALETPFTKSPVAWRQPRTLIVDVKDASTPLQLPADARNVRVSVGSNAASQFARVADDLMEYPYGCVEQTASRMIPLALVTQSTVPARELGDRLRQQLNGQRLRLAYMAGPNAQFTWWGDATAGNPFLTGYAYFADWNASRALQIDLPQEHWNRLIDVYANEAGGLPPLHRALFLHWMQEMGLNVKTQTQGLLDELTKQQSTPQKNSAKRVSLTTSTVMMTPETQFADAITLALIDRIARKSNISVNASMRPQIDAAYRALAASTHPMAEALLLLNGNVEASAAQNVLQAVRAEMPTLERSLTLYWVHAALGGFNNEAQAELSLEGSWRRDITASGRQQWQWLSAGYLPREIKLSGAPSKPMTAIVQFDSAETQTTKLPVRMERRLYRVTKRGDAHFDLEPVLDNKVATDQLYLDEVVLTATGGNALRYALLEVPLPPGASVESTTWGISLPNAKNSFDALERARHQATSFGYAVPVEPLTGTATVRHLIRFAQKGEYMLPSSRLYRMYQPEEKAFETIGRAATPWSVQ